MKKPHRACVVIRRKERKSVRAWLKENVREKGSGEEFLSACKKGKQRRAIFLPLLGCCVVVWCHYVILNGRKLTWGIHTKNSFACIIENAQKGALTAPPTNNRIIAHFHQFLICVFVCFHPSKLLLTWEWESPCGALRTEHTRQKLENIHEILWEEKYSSLRQLKCNFFQLLW